MGQERDERRVLILGADGLRPDDLSPDRTPVCWELLRRGTLFSPFHAAYPSVTRVSMSSLTTGAQPGRHGGFGNRVHIPGFPLDGGWVQTGDDTHLRAFPSGGTGGGKPYLLLPTLGDRLHAAGKTLAVASSGSPGSALLWNLNHPEKVLNPGSTYGLPRHEETHRRLGGALADEGTPPPRTDRVRWAVRALTEVHLPDPENRAMVLWLSEPDTTNHRFGLRSPEALTALRLMDDSVAEVLSAVRRLGLEDRLDLFFISDHGFSTLKPAGNLAALLTEYADGAGESGLWSTSDHYIYYRGGEEGRPGADRLQRVVDWLYGHDWCGLVFAHPDHAQTLEGVISLEAVIGPITHDRIPALAVNPTWTHAPNGHGVPGTVHDISGSKNATHGTTCPYDMRAFCLGYGPGFKEGAVTEVPCGIVDIAPTVCHLLRLNEAGFDGRVLFEGLRDGGKEAEQIERTETMLFADPQRTRGIRLFQVDGARYVNGSVFA